MFLGTIHMVSDLCPCLAEKGGRHACSMDTHILPFLAHLVKRPCELLPSLGARRRPSKLFQKSSSLKPLNQFEPNLTTIILRMSSLKIVSDVPADQRTWLQLLKVKHRGKINTKIQLKNPEKLCEGAIASKLH